LSIAKKNRQALFDKLSPNSLAILPGAVKRYRNSDVEYPFRQDSDFYYLTEFSEPGAIAVFIKPDNNPQNNLFILFYQQQEKSHHIWHGPIMTAEKIINEFDADDSYPTNQLNKILSQLLLNKEIIYYPILQNKLHNHDYLLNWQQIFFNQADHAFSNCIPETIKDLSSIIHELRVIKSPEELNKIRYATDVSAQAHNYIMQYVANHKHINERQVQAEFYNYCLQNGCDDLAYPSIVATGNNACILHYTKNKEPLIDNQLLLVDAGAEYQYYAADITRVFPVNGRFLSRQKELYEIVLTAQKNAIMQIKPGITWFAIQQEILKILVAGLVDLKILIGDVDQLIKENKYKEYYMHSSGHFLGMDVHDVGMYNIKDSSKALVPGMVLTVEPGLYIPKDSQAAAKWWGIGIRIEDDILVTDKGCEILTKGAVKEISDIEYLMLN
jgi:Xaa-Pro aminopeptidase